MPQKSAAPLWLKLAYSAFVAVLVPVYWHNYGPANFLYFCDMALLLTFFGLWREDRLLISMGACGIVAPQILWVLDFAAHAFGLKITGVTDYMFADSSAFLRGLSLFHGWLPVLLVWLVWKLGYDRRALLAWTGLAWSAMLVSYFFLPPPSPDAGLAAVNVDYVFGPSDTEPQRWMAPSLWLVTLMSGLLAVFWFPSHVVLSKWRGTAACAKKT
ncbi:hypothetical protein CCR94_20350 [Rhodoblastus sphagnicola]|uniref:Membrane-associated protein n=1 Tax=Rhodoblastus sphagnicola TaxID=333368 RepID=A0A2S6MXV3_9HYPH|nr:hypothetical protein [Rhodoblastus sphagnicola]MBB4196645.1 hypothetical protein [Rhodoblastus sphagnicola]PPQ27190.1 hypothetical protein CCR94_20350 [Rhodoblastus sphagnicola]